MLKQSTLTAILFCGFGAQHAIAMETSAQPDMITLVTKEGTKTILDRDTAFLFDTVCMAIKNTTDEDNDDAQSNIPPIHLSISKESLDTQLNLFNAPLNGFKNSKANAAIVALSMEQRQHKARICAAHTWFNEAEIPSIERLVEQYRSAHYLSIAENSEMAARMIAITLLSPENLASLASTPSNNTRPHIPPALANQINEPNFPITIFSRYIPAEMIELITPHISPWVTQWQIKSNHTKNDGDCNVCFSPDGKHVAFSYRNAVSICDVQSGQLVMNKVHPIDLETRSYANIRSLRFSSSGKFAIMAAWNHGTSLFNIQDKTTQTTQIEFSTCDAHISPDETKFIHRGYFGTVLIMSVATNQPLGTIIHERLGKIIAAFFAPSSGFIVTQSSDGTTKITMPNSFFEVLHQFKANADANNPIISPQSFSADGTRLVYGLDKQAIVIDARTFTHQYSIDHESKIEMAQFSPDASRIVIMGQSGTVSIFDTQTRRLINTFRYKGHLRSARFSPDSSKIVLRADSHLKMIDIQKGQELTSIEDSFLEDLTFSADSKLIAGVHIGDKSIHIHDGNSAHFIEKIKQSMGTGDFSFSPDSTKLAIATEAQLTLAQKFPAETLKQRLLIRVLAHACENGTFKDAWQSPWVQKILATYTKKDGSEDEKEIPDTQTVAQIKAAFEKSAAE
jgi:WD40 repeat protein